MDRAHSRSKILYAGLFILALLLLGVPEAQVESARGRALSFLSPVLKTTLNWQNRMAPRPALIVIAEPPAPATPAAQALPSCYVERDAALAELERIKFENQRMAFALKLIDPSAKLPQGIGASVIARQILWQEPVLGLDRGEADGVRLNAGVLHRGAVLGRIVAVGPHASSMALLTHHGMSIAARLAECRVEGVLQGAKEENGERLCRMSIVARDANPKVGENVLTSGYDGAFPPGYLMGVVTAVRRTGDFQWELTVRPACIDSAVEIVHVLTGTGPEVPWPAMPKKK
jgi:rod shape-determining protein MreC